MNYAQKSWNFSGKEAKMSYSVDLKREIFGKSVTDREEILAELFGIFIARDVITEKGIHFSTENISLARRVYSGLKSVTGLDIQLKYLMSKKLGVHKVYEICLLATEEKEYREFIKKLFSYKSFFTENQRRSLQE